MKTIPLFIPTNKKMIYRNLTPPEIKNSIFQISSGRKEAPYSENGVKLGVV